MRWEPDRTAGGALPETPVPLLTAMGRGIRNRCPVCGEGKVFEGFLRVVPECSVCKAPLGQLRADDAPPYVVIFLVGHLLVPIVFWVERVYEPPMWLHMVVWLPLFTLLCMLMLRPIKGAVVGWMVTLGFTGEEHGPDPAAAPLGADDEAGGHSPNREEMRVAREAGAAAAADHVAPVPGVDHSASEAGQPADMDYYREDNATGSSLTLTAVAMPIVLLLLILFGALWYWM